MYLRFSHYIKIGNSRVKTYRIAVISAKKIEIRRDVSTNGEALKQIVKRMNEGKVEPVHLDSILEDFYLENY